MAITFHDQNNHVLYVDSSNHVLYGVIRAKFQLRPGFDANTFGQPAAHFRLRESFWLAF
jgi:hypothetical protein